MINDESMKWYGGSESGKPMERHRNHKFDPCLAFLPEILGSMNLSHSHGDLYHRSISITPVLLRHPAIRVQVISTYLRMRCKFKATVPRTMDISAIKLHILWSHYYEHIIWKLCIHNYTSPYSSKMFQVFCSLSCFPGICVETSASIFELCIFSPHLSQLIRANKRTICRQINLRAPAVAKGGACFRAKLSKPAAFASWSALSPPAASLCCIDHSRPWRKRSDKGPNPWRMKGRTTRPSFQL